MKRRKSPRGLAQSRKTRSEINVQTPTGLQNMEMLINLNYGEITLMRGIERYFDNEYRMDRRQADDVMFDLTEQVFLKIADGTLDLDVYDYYDGDLENDADHGNMTQMRHLLREVGDCLFKRMNNPGIIQSQDRGKKRREARHKDSERYEQPRATEEWE